MRYPILQPLAAVALAFALPAVGSSAAAPAGGEFQVNVSTHRAEFDPSVGMDADGDFVVAWSVDGSVDGSFVGVFARRFVSTGSPAGIQFQVNTYTLNNQSKPRVGMQENGAFVVVWQTNQGQDGASTGVFARRFDAAGTGQATEFQVNQSTLGDQRYPAITMRGDGAFVVAWESSASGTFNVVARRFGSDGTALGDELMIDPSIVVDQYRPAVAADGDGDFVVVWHESGREGDGSGIIGRRFASTGIGLDSGFLANAHTPKDQREAAVAMAADGSFVVAWQSFEQDIESWGVFARRFDSAGAPVALEFQVPSFTSGPQLNPAATMDANGDFVVAWQSNEEDGEGYGVFVRAFASAGTPTTGVLQVNTFTANDQYSPDVARDGDGDFVVAWQSQYQDGFGAGIFAQRYITPIVLDVDGDGSFLPLTDGLLVLRYAFGFRGATLVTGAVGPGCTRCTAPAVEPFLAALTK